MQAAVKIRVFRPCDQGVGQECVEQGIHGVDVADQAVVEKQDQPFPGGRSGQGMKGSGRCDPDISFGKGVGDSIYDSLIGIMISKAVCQ